jgi:hypothetical protein
MEQKPQRIEGTRYVKIGHNVFNTIGKDDTPTKTICECLNCGDRFGGDANGKCAIYCKRCKTAEGRKQIQEENDKLKIK